MKKIVYAGGLLALLLFSGCAHNLEYNGIDVYHAAKQDHTFKEVRVAILVDDSDISRAALHELTPLAQKLQESLSRQGGYAVSVVHSMPQHRTADVVVNMSLAGMNKSAKGSNFWVCWPGFILFTHAWLGYGYSFSLVTTCDVMLASDKSSLGKVSIPLDLNVRYADFTTTVLNGVTWFEWSVLGAVNGCIQMVNYDSDFEPELREQVYPVYTSQIADGIIEIINAQPWKFSTNKDDTSY